MAFGTLEFTVQDIKYKNWDIILQFHMMLVGSHLVQLWSPRYRKDVIKLKSVRRKLTRTLPGFEGLSYRQRLDRVGLYSLSCRWLSSDRPGVYKIMRGITRMNAMVIRN